MMVPPSQPWTIRRRRLGRGPLHGRERAIINAVMALAAEAGGNTAAAFDAADIERLFEPFG
jgi:hypothetical protein